MLSHSLTVLAAGATLALAKTPAGFTPASNTDLVVVYNGISADNGVVISKATSALQPSAIGTTQKLTGSSYAVMMVDLDIPTNSPPQTSTLLHWMQTGLTPATDSTNLNTTNGRQNVFLLQNGTRTAPAAMYLGPGPPARTPLSHRYTQVLIDTSSITAAGMQTLQDAAKNRSGFSVMNVLMSANLMNNVVAGNSFNVTNPGPASDATGTTGSNTTTTNSGSNTGTSNSPSFTAGAGVVGVSTGLAVGLMAAAALFLGL